MSKLSSSVLYEKSLADLILFARGDVLAPPDSPASAPEYEIRFDRSRTTKDMFDRAFSALEGAGFTYTQALELRVSLAKQVRMNLVGDSTIKQYCATNYPVPGADGRFVLITKKSMDDAYFKTTERLREERLLALETSAYDLVPDKQGFRVEEFGLAVHVNTETDVSEEAYAKSMLEGRAWENSIKSHRIMKRFYFKTNVDWLEIHMSVTKTQGQTERTEAIARTVFFDAKNDLEQRFEIEIEVNYEKFKAFVGRDKSLPAVLGEMRASVNQMIYLVLAGLQDSVFPMSYLREDAIRGEYGLLIGEPDDYVHQPRLVGPNVGVLMRENLLDTIEKIDEQELVEIGKAAYIFRDYTVSHKVDGERHLLYVSAESEVYLIDSKLHVKDTRLRLVSQRDVWARSLFDGELVQSGELYQFFVFDAYYCGGETLMHLPLVRRSPAPDSQRDRAMYIEEFYQACFAASLELRHRTPAEQRRFVLTVYAKRFYYDGEGYEAQTLVLPSDCDGRKRKRPAAEPRGEAAGRGALRSHIRQLLAEQDSRVAPFPTDGLIFTPRFLGVGAASVFHRQGYSNRRALWDRLLKWKPDNTIDFRVDLWEAEPEDRAGVRKVRLMCVGQPAVGGPHAQLLSTGPAFVFGGQTKNTEVPFYVEENDARREVFEIDASLECSESGEPIANGSVVEFRYSAELDKWDPIKLRHDKEFGNRLEVALSNYYLTVHPITAAHLTGDAPLEGERIQELGGQYYMRNRVDRLENEQNMAAFHGLCVKKRLIKAATEDRYGNRTGTDIYLLDLAVGKGGDLNHWIDAGITHVFGIDQDRNNIYGPDSACTRYFNRSQADKKKKPACVYVVGDSSRNIFSLDAFSSETELLSYNVASTVFHGSASIPASYRHANEFAASLKQRDGKFDVVSIQFAVHYMFRNERTVRELVTNIAENLAERGVAIMTCFDGLSVAHALTGYKNKNQALLTAEERFLQKHWTAAQGDRPPRIVVYERGGGDGPLKKKFELVGSGHEQLFIDNPVADETFAIKVYQDTIGGEKHTEWLVSGDYLSRTMGEFGFSEIGAHTKSFREIYDAHYRADISDAELSIEDRAVSFLNRQFMFQLLDKGKNLVEKKLHVPAVDPMVAVADAIVTARMRALPRTSYAAVGAAVRVLFVRCEPGAEDEWRRVREHVLLSGEFDRVETWERGQPTGDRAVVIFRDPEVGEDELAGNESPLLFWILSRISITAIDHPMADDRKFPNRILHRVHGAASMMIRSVDPVQTAAVREPGREHLPRGLGQFARLLASAENPAFFDPDTRMVTKPTPYDCFLSLFDRSKRAAIDRAVRDSVRGPEARKDNDMEVYTQINKVLGGDHLLTKMRDIVREVREEKKDNGSNVRVANEIMKYLNAFFWQELRSPAFSFAKQTVLDYGCADGARTVALARAMGIQNPRQVLGADVRKVPKLADGFTFIQLEAEGQGAGTKLMPNIRDKSVDIVVVSMTLHHVRHQRAVLREFRRILRPSGKVVVREHHAASLEYKIYLDVLHGLYSLVWDDLIEQPRFTQEYEAFYRTKQGWTALFGRAGFDRVPVTYQFRGSEKKVVDTHYTQAEARFKEYEVVNKNNTFFATYVVAGPETDLGETVFADDGAPAEAEPAGSDAGGESDSGESDDDSATEIDSAAGSDSGSDEDSV